MNKKTLIALMVAFLISGCSDSAIDQVKEWRIEGASKYKIGQVFDNYEFCDSTEWSSSEGNSGNSIVGFNCFFSTSEEIISAVKAEVKDAIKVISDDVAQLEAKEPDDVVKYARYLKAAKERLSQANSSGNESDIKRYEQQVERESGELERRKRYHQERIDKKNTAVAKYQQVLNDIATFESGRMYFEYNVVNGEVSLKSAKVYFDDNYTYLVGYYSALARGHIAGQDMIAVWQKASKKFINSIIKELVQ